MAKPYRTVDPYMSDDEAARNDREAKGGDAPGPETVVSETAVSEGEPAPEGGPRIVINPSTFRNKKDALCVAFNEAFRVVMEDMQFDPVAEPTDRQREFFSDTAYAGDENQLRRTILARICTFDTSVKDPTDEQIQEAVEFLEYVMESGAPQNEWEQSSVQRIHDVLASVPAGQGEREGEPPAEEAPEPPADEGAVEADVGGGDADEDRKGAFGGETGLDAGIEDDLVRQGTEFDGADANGERLQLVPGAAPPADGQAEAADRAGAEVRTTSSIGVDSGIWSGGAAGKGRQLTKAEAAWMERRAASGASMRPEQRAVFSAAAGVQPAPPTPAEDGRGVEQLTPDVLARPRRTLRRSEAEGSPFHSGWAV